MNVSSYGRRMLMEKTARKQGGSHRLRSPAGLKPASGLRKSKIARVGAKMKKMPAGTYIIEDHIYRIYEDDKERIDEAVHILTNFKKMVARAPDGARCEHLKVPSRCHRCCLSFYESQPKMDIGDFEVHVVSQMSPCCVTVNRLGYGLKQKTFQKK